MSAAKMTLIAFDRFFSANNDDLFVNLTLPTGIDKDILTNNILLKGADFEVMYSDPFFLQEAIGMWSGKWQRTFEKWVAALAIEYNPLENYDRKEDWSDTLNRGVKTNARRDSGNTRTFDNQDKRTLDTENKLTLDSENKRTLDTTETTERQVSAYDSSSYQPAEKTTVENDGTDTLNNTGTETTNNTGTDTMNYTGTITDEFGEGTSGSETENSKTVRDGRIHGNIGVTTSQQMLEAELKIAEWNMYEHITDLFLSEFVIPIYS